MTDSRLQQLKRAWEASGTVVDESAWLRERVRVGELTQERLELAAYCGNDASEVLVEATASGPPKDLRDWALGLAEWGKEASVRSAYAAALAHYRQREFSSDVLRSLRATRTWILCQSESHRKAAQEAARRHFGGTVRAATEAAWAAAVDTESRSCRKAARAIAHASSALGEHAIRVAIQEAMARWALGYSDPVQERLEGRAAHKARRFMNRQTPT